MREPPTGPEAAPEASSSELRLSRWVLLALILGFAVWLNLQGGAQQGEMRAAIERFGYLGLLAVAAISGFNLVVPIPVIAFFPFLIESGLEPIATVLVIAVGMTLGDLIGYLIGRLGREAIDPPSGSLLSRLGEMRERHPLLPYGFLFLYAAFAPIPNELVVLPMAFLRYHPLGMFAAVLAGNLIFNSLAAAGFLGVFGLFG